MCAIKYVQWWRSGFSSGQKKWSVTVNKIRNFENKVLRKIRNNKRPDDDNNIKIIRMVHETRFRDMRTD
jgi:hypothetical protein